MIENIIKKYRRVRYLNKYQSLSYQLMIILMEEHRAARLGQEIVGEYSGGNRLFFDEKSWVRLKLKASKIVSYQYSQQMKDLDNDELLALMSHSENFYKIEVLKINESACDGGIVSFEMKGEGYSYQYNGYKRSPEKLQRTANRILIATFLYYVVTIFFTFEKIELKTISTYIPNILKTIPQNIYSYTIHWNLLPTIIIFYIIWQIVKKIYNFRFK